MRGSFLVVWTSLGDHSGSAQLGRAVAPVTTRKLDGQRLDGDSQVAEASYEAVDGSRGVALVEIVGAYIVCSCG
jgi:hypothetical protein